MDINGANNIAANVSCTNCTKVGMDLFYNSYLSPNYFETISMQEMDLPESRNTEGFTGSYWIAEDSWELFPAFGSSKYNNVAYLNRNTGEDVTNPAVVFIL